MFRRHSVNRAYGRTLSAFLDAITEAADGLDRIGGLPEFFAKPAHVGIDGPRVDDAFVAPDFVQQAVPFLNASLPAHQHAEEPELHAGQAHLSAADIDLMARWIER